LNSEVYHSQPANKTCDWTPSIIRFCSTFF